MIFLVLLCLCFIFQLFFSVWYSLAESAHGRKGAVKFGIISSALYFLSAVFSLLIAYKRHFLGIYSYMIIISMTIFFIGDLLYILKKNKFTQWKEILHTLAGIVLSGAFIYKVNALFNNITPYYALIIFSVVAFGIIYTIIYKVTKTKDLLKSLYVFSGALVFSTSLNLGIRAQITGEAIMQSLSCAVICGSLVYFISVLFSSEIIKFKNSTDRTRLYKNCLCLFSLMILSCSVALVGG